jgi:AcrR family transcriptional regulator
MGRPAIHSDDAILDSARSLVLDGGARAATLNAVARASGAPKGSIYHRFASLDDLLARMWMRAVRRAQADFIAALREPDATRAAVAAALSIHDFAVREPADARLLAALRRQDLIARVAAPELRRELAEANRALEAEIARLSRRIHGRATRDAVERTLTAIVDLPMGAVRRHLAAGRPLPRSLRRQLEAAVRAALAASG